MRLSIVRGSNPLWVPYSERGCLEMLPRGAESRRGPCVITLVGTERHGFEMWLHPSGVRSARSQPSKLGAHPMPTVQRHCTSGNVVACALDAPTS